jgi:hypothetical protein
MTPIVCIGCGLTDARGCAPIVIPEVDTLGRFRFDPSVPDEKGCYWVSWVEETGQGLCSRCASRSIDELIEMWEHPRNHGAIV